MKVINNDYYQKPEGKPENKQNGFIRLLRLFLIWGVFWCIGYYIRTKD